MADTDTDTARRLAEIRKRADAATPGGWAVDGHEGEVYPVRLPSVTVADCSRSVGWGDPTFIAHARDDIPYLLDLVAARDRELAELGGMLADLCEDSRAAAAAVRYRRALERLATIPPFGGRGDDWDELCPEVRRIANEALKGEPP